MFSTLTKIIPTGDINTHLQQADRTPVIMAFAINYTVVMSKANGFRVVLLKISTGRADLTVKGRVIQHTSELSLVRLRIQDV